MIRMNKAIKRCSWILLDNKSFVSSSDMSLYFFAILRKFGTVIPINMSPSPYSPGQVLKYLKRFFARSGSARLFKLDFKLLIII